MDTGPARVSPYWSPCSKLSWTVIHHRGPHWPSPLPLVSSFCAGQIEPFLRYDNFFSAESIRAIMAMVMRIDCRICVLFHPLIPYLLCTRVSRGPKRLCVRIGTRPFANYVHINWRAISLHYSDKWLRMVEIGYAIGEVRLHKCGKQAIMMTLSK